MGVADRYTYRVAWSPEDEEFVATVAELPGLSWLAPKPTEALTGIHDVVEHAIQVLQQDGKPVPAPFADREFSGKFQVRVPPRVHRQLAVEAAEQGVSLNRWINARLTRT